MSASAAITGHDDPPRAPMPVGTGPGLSAEDRAEAIRAKRAHLLALSPQRYPNVISCADSLTDCIDGRSYDDLGIDLLIAGIHGVHPASRS